MDTPETSPRPSAHAPDSTMQMTACRVYEFGSPDVIRVETIERPQPGPGEVLVRVKAAGVGPWDAWIRAGRSVLPQPLPLTLGSDLSGIVDALGPDVADFSRGDAVYGVTNSRFTDAYAEYAIAHAEKIAHKPRELTDLEAASVPVVAVTAWQMLFDVAQLKPGQTVLVHGAAGSVGWFAVQLAHHAGARVLATASAVDIEPVKTIGADEVFDFRAGPFEEMTGPVDIVLDTVGGDTLTRSFSVLEPGGVLVSIVSKPDEIEAAKQGVRAEFLLVDVKRDELTKIAEMLDSGTLTTNVGLILPLTDARIAHEMLEHIRPRPFGKIVLSVSE